MDLTKLPSLAFKKIYRALDFSDQDNLFSALEETSNDHLLRAVENYRQPISCFLCQATLFQGSFWSCAGRHRDHEPESKYFKREPRLGSRGFNIMYTAVTGDRDSEFGKLFRVRNFHDPEDMFDADEIFLGFQEALGNVFRADKYTDLVAHLKKRHNLDYLNNFNDCFYRGLFCREG